MPQGGKGWHVSFNTRLLKKKKKKKNDGVRGQQRAKLPKKQRPRNFGVCRPGT